MKKFFILIAALGMSLSACGTQTLLPAQNQTPAQTATHTPDNPLGGLGSLLGGGNKEGGSGSGLGNILGGVVNGLLGTDKISPDRLVGTWNYSGPAVCFKTEDLLKKAGGSAMASTLESKLEPYYNKFGLNKMVLVVNQDQTFTMTSGALRMSGDITIDGEDVYFNFKALGTISLGKIKTYVNMGVGGKSMSLMFDVSKLMTVLKAIGGMTNLQTLNTVNSLLGSYDGLAAGFKLAKQ